MKKSWAQSQRDWRRRKARRVLLAEAPLSLAIRRMLVADEWLSPDRIEDKKAVGEAVAAAFEEMLVARNA